MASPGDAERSARWHSWVTWVARRWPWAAAVGVLVVVAVIAVFVVARQPGDGSAASPSRSGSASPAVGTAAPSAPPSPAGTPAPSPQGSPSAVPEPSERSTAAPVELADPATPAPGLEVSLRAIEPVDGVASLPGDVGGPALRVTVDVHNATDAAVDLTGLVTNLYFGRDRTPALGLEEPGAKAMPLSVAPGATATGVYVFVVPADQRAQVAVEVDTSVESKVVLFAGPVG